MSQEDMSLMQAYLDGELDAATSRDLERRLSTDARARAALEQLRGLSSALRRDADYHRAPAEVRAMFSVVGREASMQSLPAKTGRFAPWWRTAAIAAAAAVLATAVTVAVVRPSVEQVVERDVYSAHMRAMVSGRLTDVASSDRHTVKPWLSSRLGFSPQVPDLADRGFELVGGRVDVIDGESAAVLVYRRRQHVIDVFVRPAGRESDAAHSTRNGLNVVHLRQADTSLWLVSDLNANELNDLARLLSAALGST